MCLYCAHVRFGKIDEHNEINLSVLQTQLLMARVCGLTSGAPLSNSSAARHLGSRVKFIMPVLLKAEQWIFAF